MGVVMSDIAGIAIANSVAANSAVLFCLTDILLYMNLLPYSFRNKNTATIS
jgi:hypothetical protein